MSPLTVEALNGVLEANGVTRAIPLLEGANINVNPMDIYKSYLAQAIVQSTACDTKVALDAIQFPNEAGMGDLVLVLPRLKLQESELQGAMEQLRDSTGDLLPLFGSPMADGIHQRVFLNVETLGHLLVPYILGKGTTYGNVADEGLREEGCQQTKAGKVIVDFSSPNLGKEFDGNHLRSTIHGAFVAAIYEFQGYNVYRVNFLGDWGKHIGILAEGWGRFGSEASFEAAPLAHLLDCFTKANDLLKSEQADAKKAKELVDGDCRQSGEASTVTDGTAFSEQGDGMQVKNGESLSVASQSVSDSKDAFFKKLEDGDPDARALWRRFREVCIANYTELYQQMNVHFDEHSGESVVGHETISEVESMLTEKGVYTESEHAWIIDFRKLGYKHLGTGIARYRNGTTSYLLRDIATVLERSRKHAFDKMIYVVASRQETHFLQVFKALELMGMADLAAKLQHVGFGKVTGLEPRSARPGLLLEDILAQCQETVQKFMANDPASTKDFNMAETGMLGAAALACQDLAAGKRNSTFKFDGDEIGSTEGWTGLTLQMWLRRLTGVTQEMNIDMDVLLDIKTDYSLLASPPYQEPLRLLLEFPHAISVAYKTLESAGLVVYLYRLTDPLPAIWEEEAEHETPAQLRVRLAFLECVRLVLTSGLNALGLRS